MPVVMIRDASVGDLAALRKVFRTSSLSNEQDRPLFAAHPELLDFAGPHRAGARTRVAIVNDRVVGFASVNFSANTAELVDLFVDPDWTERGIGRALVDDAFKQVLAVGRNRVEVDANRLALGFYTKLGFMTRGEVSVEYGTAFRMSRELS